MDELIIIGDRVLIEPDEDEKQTKAGLYLPASVAESDRVGSGLVVKIGPGYVLPNPEYSEGEPWAADRSAVRYLPLQAQPGDHAFYLRKESIELSFRDKKYLIVQHGAILALVRSHTDADDILKGLDDIEDLLK
ncbi:MAG TPA: co-chaperone GroES family protein [Rhodothermales bacterium]|nr:co-chaperone GroES family protein [Rhodothermales bacterium]